MDKIVSYCLVVFYSLMGLVPSCHAATNLALGKSYSVSPIQNFSLSAPPTDHTSLTDGKYSVGGFWVQKTTLGWHPVKSVEIMIDLENASVIDGISFSTARGNGSGVFYPIQIAAFVGADKDHLMYVGDIADDPGNQEGPYETKRFLLSGISAKGRYVLLEVTAPRSGSIFCDEIEVLKGSKDNGKAGSLSVEGARIVTERLKWLGSQTKLYNALTSGNNLSVIAQNDLSVRLKAIMQRAVSLPLATDTAGIESDVLSLRAEVLRVRFPGHQILVETVNAWAPLTPIASVSGVIPKNISFSLPQGGSDHAALLLTNPSSASSTVSLSGDPVSQDAPLLSLYQLPFLKGSPNQYVADPLVPVQGGITLAPGESRVVFVSVQGRKPGSWQTHVTITKSGLQIVIPVQAQVGTAALPQQLTLNAVNWSYLDFALIRKCKVQAVKDLFSHHTNVIVVPPEYLEGANQAKALEVSDIIRLENYLKYHRGATKVLLGVGFGSANRTTVVGRYPFLSAQWKEGFRKWYSGTIHAAVRAGFSEDQLYIYPYDEMGGQQIDDFVRFAAWVKQEIPRIKLYATLGESTLATKGWEKVLPYLDIVQAFDERMLNNSTSSESWIYSASGPAKILSPYSYYRLMAWKAFLGGYKGIGFWAYADTGPGDEPGSAWDDFDGKYPDFAVIYEGSNNTIISSRRWEAWKMGIEDYELLTMYAKSVGGFAVRNLAKMVLDQPEDTTKADEVRRKIVMKLSARE